ncbi:hypothetical protein [uncultured Ferrimonas sp.]|uniref:hypothetical protein n=1 Tax=uncultured Ferrimonas sp. TaxID=432640 RepID=UPI002613ECFC|nr:hypothetical protein [uncultured Ferrimonas sp.]
MDTLKLGKLFALQVNLSGLFTALATTVILMQLLTLLPAQYYFGFAKLVDSDSSPFLISPPYVESEPYQQLLQEKGISAWGGGMDKNGEWIELGEAPTAERIKQLNNAIVEQGQPRFWSSLLLKGLPPLLAGFLLYFLWREQAHIAVPVGAGLAALSHSWPVILLWDWVVSAAWSQQQSLFMVLYMLYVLLYFHLARLGVMLAEFCLEKGLIKNSQFQIDLGKTMSSLVTTGITVGITWFVTTAIARAA